MNEIWVKLKDKLLTREMISYLIAGVLTTLVNIVSYHFLCDWAGIENLIANGAAWVISVIFAYYVNNKYVFSQEKTTIRQELKKWMKFMAARIFSFGVDELGMFLLVDLFYVNNLLSKLIMNVFVVIINYIFSKWFIFRSKEPSNSEETV